MQLIYRGIKYETSIPSVATTEGKVIGKYRGLPWHQQVSVSH